MSWSRSFVFAATLGSTATLSGNALPGGVGGNSPPFCTNPPVIFVECNNQGSPTVHTFDVGAVDPDGDPLTFLWAFTGSCAPIGTVDDPTAETPTVLVDMQGGCMAECGGVKARISDGVNPPVECKQAIVIQDTTPPVTTCPADVLELWDPTIGGYPAQVDPMIQGFATALDNCDPSPGLAIVDELVQFGTPPSGIEVVVTRTWEAVDCMGFTDRCTQTITLVGPSFFAGTDTTIDLAPGACPNEVLVPSSATAAAPVEILIHGSAVFDVRSLRAHSLVLVRADGAGAPAEPVGVMAGDFGAPQVGQLCHDTVADGYADRWVTFDAAQVADALGLWTQPNGQALAVQLLGELVNGQPFVAKDVLIVRQ